MTNATQVLRRFLVLRASRWFPTGLLIPVLVLFLVDRGLSLGQVGLAFAAQGLMVMVLELPTGGLADAIGRRRTLIVASVFELASIALLLIGRSLIWFAVGFAIQGVYRALESGPLDAWFVDATRAADETADIEPGLAKGGVVLGISIAFGAVLSGVLVATDPFPAVGALAVPFVVALALRVVDTALIWRLMIEDRPGGGIGSIKASIGDVPSIVRSGLRLVRTSSVLGLLLGVEMFWGFGMMAFEGIFPVRLGEVTGSAEVAGSLMGPVSAVAWLASAGGAGAIAGFSRRFGQHVVASSMRILQGATVAAMGVFAGPVGLVTAYLTCFVVHGAANPVHSALIHAEAEAANRATVVSLNSLSGSVAGAVGGIMLGVIADRGGTSIAMYVGAAALAAAAPLYLIARSRQGDRSMEATAA